jgi:hypothetical protein
VRARQKKSLRLLFILPSLIVARPLSNDVLTSCLLLFSSVKHGDALECRLWQRDPTVGESVVHTRKTSLTDEPKSTLLAGDGSTCNARNSQRFPSGSWKQREAPRIHPRTTKPRSSLLLQQCEFAAEERISRKFSIELFQQL